MSKELPTIAKNIRKYRQQAGLSQDKLSKLANVSHTTIVKIEAGVIKSPTIDTVQRISEALKVSVDELIK